MVVGFNLLMKVFRNGHSFTLSELVTVYSMVALGGWMLSSGFIGSIIVRIMAIPTLVLQQPTGPWEDIKASLSHSVVPFSQSAIVDFWRGDASVPWEEWIAPIFVFTLFFGIIFWCMLCIAVLIRRHWEDYEKLVYPLTLPVLELGKAATGAVSDSLFHDRLFLVGAIFPVGLGLLTLFNSYYPAIPSGTLSINLGQYFLEPPLSMLNTYPSFLIIVNWLVLGIGYFLPLDVSFGIWFFVLFFKFQQVFAVALGLPLRYDGVAEPYMREQSLGAGIALAIMYLWTMRYHLGQVFRKVFKGEGTDDSDEPLSYKTAFWGLVLGMVVIALSAKYLFGIAIIWSLLIVGTILLTYITGSRARAEAGFPHNANQAGMLVFNLGHYVGSKNIDLVTRVSMGTYYNVLSHYGFFGGGMPLALETYKMGASAGMKRRSLTHALLIAFFSASIIGFVTALPVIYENGMTVGDSFKVFLAMDAGAQSAAQEFTRHVGSGIAIAVSGVFTAVLAYFRSSFVWWPFNPIGYFLAGNEWNLYMWSSFMIVWFIKALIFRYGGMTLYRKLQPMFLGMVMGAVGMEVVNSLVGITVHFLS